MDARLSQEISEQSGVAVVGRRTGFSQRDDGPGLDAGLACIKFSLGRGEEAKKGVKATGGAWFAANCSSRTLAILRGSALLLLRWLAL